MFKQACACCVPVYTSLCLVISHSVFVLMSSVINSPLVGLLIYIFTYLHSLLVAACLSPSASGKPPVAPPVMSFSAPSPHLVRFEPALFRLKHSSVSPHRKAAGRIQNSAERKMRRGLCALRKKKRKKLRGLGSPASPVTSRKAAAISITPAPHLTDRVMERHTR